MRQLFKLMIVSFLMLFLCAGSALATNITILDGNANSETGWYGKGEDQEVEPGMVANQNWDMEGFFLDGLTLTIVGGFDFINGVVGNQDSGVDRKWTSGDIFIDTTVMLNLEPLIVDCLMGLGRN